MFLIFLLSFLTLCLFLILSIWFHEYSHALAAKILGWKTHGMTIVWKKAAIGYKIEINQDKPEDIWKIAAAGLLGTIILSMTALFFSFIFPIFSILFYMNIGILLINLIPISGSDGTYLWKRIKAHFRRPSGTHSET